MIPTAGVNRVFGLLDLLKAYDGKVDVAHLMSDLKTDIDEFLPTIDTAEYLGFVQVLQGEISLTDLGKKASTGRIQERKKLVQDKLEKLEPFSDLIKLLKDQKQLGRFELARYLSSKYGYTTDLQTILKVIISWGVFSGLFRYDGQSESLRPRKLIK
jgi:NitT/TauT family transport system ATP-binding protein